jgi:carbonic anhydrase
MAPPYNYVNTEIVDNYCFDSCEFQYNYQPIDLPVAIPNNNKIFQIPISNPNNYKCKFSGEKYKLTNVYIILNTDEQKQIQHTYERYETGTIIGELIMSHKNENNTHNLNICMAIKGVDFDTDLNEILNGAKENNKMFLNDYLPSKSYNYYYSENSTSSDGDSNTHWIVFDYNQHILSINKNTTSTGKDSIIVPKAPSTINSVQYHERGPQYMEKSRQVSCTRISTNLENLDSKSEKTLFKNGLFGQKDPVIVSLLFFILFILFVFIVMGIIYIIKNWSSILSSIKSTTTSGVDLVKKIRKSGES